MNSTFYIERAVLASALNSEMPVELNKGYFTTPFHQKLVSGINHLKKLGEYVDFEVIRNKFLKAKKWSIEEDNMLTDIMTNTTPFGSIQMVNAYINILKEESKMNLDRRYSI